jgi:Cd2+/Zn2+-exporting ATPase
MFCEIVLSDWRQKMSGERSFILENLSCPHCAASIEKKAVDINGVTAANVDLVMKKLTLTHDNSVEADKLKSYVEAVVKSVEPSINLLETSHGAEFGRKHKPESFVSKELIRLIAGAVVYILGFAAVILHINRTLTIGIFAVCLIIAGGQVFIKAIGNIIKGQVFDENLLMSIAAIGAFAIGQFEEGAAVMLFNQVGEYFQDFATNRSKKSIAELMNLRPDYVNLKIGSETLKVSPEDVKIGQLFEVRPGESVPLDGVVVEGRSFVDTSALTGEPVPREIGQGGYVTGGFINGDGLLTVRVEKAYGESTVARIINLVENAGSKKAKAENFITSFARYYTPTVTIAAVLIALLPPLLFGLQFNTWIYRALVFLVVSCPCALVVSVPLGFFAGIGAASHNGILVKGGNYMEQLARLETVVFDKTGTLTKGLFEVVKTVCQPGVSSQKLLEAAALAEVSSNHPIAKSIIKASDSKPDKSRIKSFMETAGFGVVAQTEEGSLLAGNEKLLERENITYTPCYEDGTLVYIASGGVYLGCLVISDIVKSDAAAAVEGLHKLGIKKTVMLTGDRERAARSMAQTIGINEVHARLMPDEKVTEFEKIARATAGVTAFVGDGINDAPVLARADVGIAMGGIGSDAAVEAADIVIMDDKPARVVTAVRISRYVNMIVRQNIIFALSIKFIVLILGALGFANIWAAVFADTGVAILAVFNSLRVLIRREKFSREL